MRERLEALGEIAAEVAHELRNVLQAIATQVYLAQQSLVLGGAEEPEQREGAGKARETQAPAAGRMSSPGGGKDTGTYLAKIAKNTAIAQGIVDDLMVLARGEMALSSGTALADLVLAARGHFDSNLAKWEEQVDPPHLTVCVHPGLMTRLLHVLYENAIAASRPRVPKIRTRAWLQDGALVLEVSDDGPGVPLTIADHVFDPMVSARPGGTGLGLALAMRIARAHGGTLLLAPPQLGLGATFRLVFPDLPPTGLRPR